MRLNSDNSRCSLTSGNSTILVNDEVISLIDATNNQKVSVDRKLFFKFLALAIQCGHIHASDLAEVDDKVSDMERVQ